MTRKGDQLGIWLNEARVATLFARDEVGHVSCQYVDDALSQWSLNSPVLSCSLPLSESRRDATAFFRGLLPEGEALRIMAERINVVPTDTFALLEHYGKDVAGAIVVAREEPAAREFSAEVMSAGDLQRAVDDLDENPLGIVDESELSLAGLQDKILLVKEGRWWARPLNGLPSTHILKVDDLRHPGLVRAEHSCLLLAREIGLTTIDAELIEVGDRECLIVSRFDRETTDGKTRRIHQEDLCQAKGIDPVSNRSRSKYERWGGPGFKAMAELLDSYSEDPSEQLQQLVKIVTFTVAIGNADAHGKNLALMHPSPTNVSLAPLYDTVPTRLWPKLRPEAAMLVGGQPVLEDITLAGLAREAHRWSFREDLAKEVATSTAAQIRDLAARGFIPDPGVSEYVLARVVELLETA